MMLSVVANSRNTSVVMGLLVANAEKKFSTTMLGCCGREIDNLLIFLSKIR